MSLRPRLLASTSFLISSLCAGALAQTPPTPSPQSPAASASPAPAPAAPAPSSPSGVEEGQPATTPAPEEAPAAAGMELPTISVTAPKPSPKPTQAKPAQARQAAQATAPTAPSPPTSSYETGAPNIAGGTPPVPQLASQMTISGAELNSRPMATNTEILEAAPGLAVVQHSVGQRFLGSNHIRRPRRACRTMCG